MTPEERIGFAAEQALAPLWDIFDDHAFYEDENEEIPLDLTHEEELAVKRRIIAILQQEVNEG